MDSNAYLDFYTDNQSHPTGSIDGRHVMRMNHDGNIFVYSGSLILEGNDSGNISGSSTSTGSFGAVSIGKGTADNQRALTIVGDVQLDNNAKIYFKRSTGTADPFIGYNSSDNFQIFNPLSTEIQFAIGSGEIVAVDGGGLTFNGSKYIAAGGGSGVLSVIGNSGLKLKSGAAGGSGPIELIQGSTTYWSVGPEGNLTGSADLVMNAGKNISGSSTSTGSFGRINLASSNPVIGNNGVIIRGASASTGC